MLPFSLPDTRHRLLMPVLGWSRVRMARHRLDEVIGGGLLGLATAAALRWLG